MTDSRTFHYDASRNRILATDHPSVRRHLVVQGLPAIPARVARQFTRPVGSVPEARDAMFQLLNGNWTGPVE